MTPRTILACLAIVGLALPCLAESPSVTRLTNFVHSYPHPSPDGSKVVFQSNLSGAPQIHVMNADGSDIVQLTDEPLGAETPKWSPDGRSILFAAYVGDDDNDLFLMDLDGQNIRRLTESPGYDGHASWSADGSRIIFNSDRTSPDMAAPWNLRWHEIFSMKPDGSDLRQHTKLQTICTYPSFSPDMTQVVYRKVVDGPGVNWNLSLGQRNSEVFVADADGANERNLSASAAFDGWPAWSPDGALIAFASNRAGPTNVGQLYVVSPDGSGLRQVTEGPWSHVQPAWSTDSRFLYAYRNVETADYEFGDVVVVEVGP